jgi:hypothetical protein
MTGRILFTGIGTTKIGQLTGTDALLLRGKQQDSPYY